MNNKSTCLVETKMGHPGLFLFIFRLFQTIFTILQQIYVKNVHPIYGAGIRTHDLQNMSLLPQPLDQSSRLLNIFISELKCRLHERKATKVLIQKLSKFRTKWKGRNPWISPFLAFSRIWNNEIILLPHPPFVFILIGQRVVALFLFGFLDNYFRLCNASRDII